MKTEIGLAVIATLLIAAAPMTCSSPQPTPAVAATQQSQPEDDEAEVGETGSMVDLEDKDCDEAIDSIHEQSARIDDGMSEIQKDLEELKKRKKIKKVTKKKIKTKKVIDK
jgi:septal ring factor EnvC (AmiA/AmiB activator)